MERKEKKNVFITSNPLSCSKCSSKPFLTWFPSKLILIIRLNIVYAYLKTGIKGISVKYIVQKIYDRKEIITWSVVDTTFFTSNFLSINRD